VGNDQATNNFTQAASSVLAKMRNGDLRARSLWNRIKEVCAKVLVSEYPQIITAISNREIEQRTHQLRRKYATPEVKPTYGRRLDPLSKFFHLVGIDIMINENMDPIALELNDRPSMCVTFDLEAKLKPQLVYDVLQAVTTDGSVLPPESSPPTWEQIIPPPNGSIMEADVKEMMKKSLELVGCGRVSNRNALSGTFPKSASRTLPPLSAKRSNGQ
jgi:hypothetical protein